VHDADVAADTCHLSRRAGSARWKGRRRDERTWNSNGVFRPDKETVPEGIVECNV
jgi:hypothetical protein